MSETTSERGEAAAQELLHYGVKGMKWGVRKDDEKSGRESPRKERYNAIRNRELRNLTVEAKNGKSLEMRENRVPAVTAFISSFGKNSVQNSANNAFFDLHSDGKRVGEASFKKVSDDEINLVWLGVRSSQRGQGYGSAAFDSAVAYGRSQGVSKLTLEVPGNAPDARHIYTKRGFSVTKEEPWDPVWGGLTHMELDLKAAGLSHSDLTADDEIELAIMQTFPQLSTEQEQELDNLKSDKEVAMSDMNSLEERGEAAVQELFHYGVKGMKWGVRKDYGHEGQRVKTKKLDKLDKKFEKSIENVNQGRGNMALHNAAVSRLNQRTRDLNESDEFRDADLNDPETSARYDAAAKEIVMRTFEDAVREVYGSNASGSKKGVYNRATDKIDIVDRDVRHASSDVPDFVVKFTRDDKRFITKMELVELDDDGNELKHYGVKGMKWGVRNDKGHEGERVKTKKLDKLDKQWEKANSGVHGWVKVNNAVADRMNNGLIDQHNSDPRWAGLDDFNDTRNPKVQEYFNEYEKLANKVWAEETVKLGSNPSGTKAYELREDENGEPYGYLAPVKKDVQHAEGDVESVLRINKDANGRITDVERTELELKHYGVKGMRWGVRKDDKGASSGPKEVVVTQKKPGTYAKAKGGQGHGVAEDAERALVARRKAQASTTDALSNQELRQLVERMNLEVQYRRLNYEADRRSAGARFVAGLFGDKRYGKNAVKYEDIHEEMGAQVRDAFKEAKKDAKKDEE